MKRLLIPVGLVLGLLSSTAASASSVTFGFTSGLQSATALFQNINGNLVVTLTNTGTDDPRVPTDLLTALFFDVSGAPTLTADAANMCATCTVLNGPSLPAPYVVGGEWAYRSDASVLAFGGHYGISSTGLGVFGSADRFPGDDLDPPVSPAGLNYGITTLNDKLANDNGGLDVPRIKNSVTFTLGGFGSSTDVSSAISNVTFLYGTALNEPHYTGCVDCSVNQTSVPTPEPVSLVLLGSSLLSGGYAARRRRKHAATTV